MEILVMWLGWILGDPHLQNLKKKTLVLARSSYFKDNHETSSIYVHGFFMYGYTNRPYLSFSAMLDK